MPSNLTPQLLNLSKIDQQLGNKFWEPETLAKINEWVIQAVAVKGEFNWHTHPFDELLIVQSGEVTIEIEEQDKVILQTGQALVIPKDLKHKIYSIERAFILLIEPESHASSELTQLNVS